MSSCLEKRKYLSICGNCAIIFHREKKIQEEVTDAKYKKSNK